MYRTFTYCILLLLAREGSAAESERADMLIGQSRLKEMPLRIPEHWEDFYQRVAGMSRNKFENLFFDRANPLRMRIHDLSTTDPNNFLVSKGYVTSSLKYAFREIAVDTAFVQNSEDWLRGFVEGVVGNTSEEQFGIAETAQLQYSEESWRQKIRNENFLWGARLFRWPNPYVYVSGKLGHMDGEEIALWHIRYYLKEFRGQRVEALVSLPLPEKFFLSSGMVYSPIDDYRRLGRMYVATLRLEKWFKNRAGAMFFGVELYKKLDITTGFFKEF